MSEQPRTIRHIEPRSYGPDPSGMGQILSRRGIPDAAQDKAAVIRRAISDPGSLLPRLADESLTNWQTRAVLAALSEA